MRNRVKYLIKLLKQLIFKLDDYKKIKKMNKFQKILFYIKKIFLNVQKLFNIFICHKLYVYYVEIVLTTICTLNCQGCSALMNYYSKKLHVELNKNIKALNRMTQVCDSIEQLRLLGGEPLCYPYLYEILNYINNQDKIKKATIVTNGTLMIKDRRVLKLLQNNKFWVYISDYGKVSKMKIELLNQLKDYNINYIISEENRMWRDYGNLKCRNRIKKELCNQKSNCPIMCSSIFNGQLHYCPRSSHGTYLKKIPLRKKDYIDLLDENIENKQLKKQMYKFFFKYVPYVEACNYCNAGTNEIKSIPPGKQL